MTTSPRRVGTQHQHLGQERADLARREVDDRQHLPADSSSGA
jgi:hypothetical protein